MDTGKATDAAEPNSSSGLIGEIPQLIDAKYVSEYKVWVKFRGGAEGVIDFTDELWGPVFEPLKDPTYFGSVRLSFEWNCICWDNGADFAPGWLYEAVTGMQA